MQNWPFLFKVLLACKSSYLVLVLVHTFSGRDGGSWCLKYLFNSCLSSKSLAVLSLHAGCLHLAQVLVLLEGLFPVLLQPLLKGESSGKELSGLCVLQLCLFYRAGLSSGLCGTGWVPKHRLNAGQPLQVSLESQLGRDIKPFWELHGCEARHRDGHSPGFPSLSLTVVSAASARKSRSHLSQCWCFLAAWAVQPCSLLERIPWQQHYVLFLGRVAKFWEW